MTTETSGSGRPRRRGLRAVLQVVGLAVALLAISEAVWLWQTWPVRELLQPAATGAPAGVRP